MTETKTQCPAIRRPRTTRPSGERTEYMKLQTQSASLCDSTSELCPRSSLIRSCEGIDPMESGMRALNGIMLAVLLVTGAGVTGADAEEARTGEVALIGATVLDHDVSGELAVDDADDLRELGGALLVSGETT